MRDNGRINFVKKYIKRNPRNCFVGGGEIRFAIIFSELLICILSRIRPAILGLKHRLNLKKNNYIIYFEVFRRLSRLKRSRKKKTPSTINKTLRSTERRCLLNNHLITHINFRTFINQV